MKIYILEQSTMSLANTIAEHLSEKLNNFNHISKFITTDSSLQHTFMTNDDLILALKNNVMLFVESNKNEEFLGITLDEYFISDLLPLKISQFNAIIDEYVSNNLIIWLDDKSNKDTIKKDLSETNYLMERLEKNNLKYLYFYNENEEDILSIITKYIEGNEEDKLKIEEEYK